MATGKSGKLTKSLLIKEIDGKLQALNLLRSALQADPSRKNADLVNYQRQFYELVNVKAKKG